MSICLPCHFSLQLNEFFDEALSNWKEGTVQIDFD